MRCLYCSKQLAFFRRLTGSGDFCSDAHRQSYREEYNRLALTRLIAAQSNTEEAKPLQPSTMQMATVDRPKKAPPERAALSSGQGWGELKDSGLKPMLEAGVTEPEPPDPATFILIKPQAANFAVAPPQLAEPDQLPWTVDVSLPELSHSHVGDPEMADPIKGRPLADTAPAAPKQVDVETAVEGPATFGSVALNMDVRATYRFGFAPADPVPIDAALFAPKVAAEPETHEEYEPFRFAVMFFGAPRLTLLSGLEQAERVAPDVLMVEPPTASSFSGLSNLNYATQPVQTGNLSSMEARISSGVEALRVAAGPPLLPPKSALRSRKISIGQLAAESIVDSSKPAAIKVKLASLGTSVQERPEPLTAAPKKVVERLAGTPEMPAAKEGNQGTGKPRPQLPSIPVSQRRTAPIGSIPEAGEPHDEPKSLWGALRKYIKK